MHNVSLGYIETIRKLKLGLSLDSKHKEVSIQILSIGTHPPLILNNHMVNLMFSDDIRLI